MQFLIIDLKSRFKIASHRLHRYTKLLNLSTRPIYYKLHNAYTYIDTILYQDSPRLFNPQMGLSSTPTSDKDLNTFHDSEASDGEAGSESKDHGGKIPDDDKVNSGTQ